jgi:hypothetical protein
VPRDDAAGRAVTSAIPTLLLSGGFDPITPPAWAQFAAESLSDGTVVTVAPAGHAVLGVDPCIAALAQQFLDDLAVDDPDRCVDRLSGIEFSLGLDLDVPGERVSSTVFVDATTIRVELTLPSGWEEIDVPDAAVWSSATVVDTGLVLVQAQPDDGTQPSLAEDIAWLAPEGDEPAAVSTVSGGGLSWERIAFDFSGGHYVVLRTRVGAALITVLVQADDAALLDHLESSVLTSIEVREV